MATGDYRAVAAIARARREAALPKEHLLPAHSIKSQQRDVTRIVQTSSHFTHDEIEIVESEAEDILQKIRSQIWTAVEVTEAFCKAATVAQQLTNCLTEILFPEALASAAQLDAHQKSTGEVVGPLHGLPISLKDCFMTPPYPSGIGMAGHANSPTEDETVLVTLLRDLGAVLYVKTATPVAMMMMETSNNIYGPALNPHHLGLSPGGSSGGEAALIAMRGSPLGIGTDIGGSIRIPSAFCHLYGLKPSLGRWPQAGGRSGIPGQDYVYAVNGPMARSLSTLQLYAAATLSPAAAPWLKDAKCIPIPWREGPHIRPPGRKLRLAFVGSTDGLVTCHPPVERGLRATRAAVEAAGHETLDWALPEQEAMMALLVGAFVDFGGQPIVAQLAAFDEPVFASMANYAAAAAAARAAPGGVALGPDRMRELNLRRNALQNALLARWMATAAPAQAKEPVDAVVMAASPWAAVREGFTFSAPKRSYFGYTGWASLLDLCVCTFPVLKADKALDVAREGFQGVSELDAAVQADYDAEFYHGAPVGLQCIALRLHEEKCLEVVALIDECLKTAGVHKS